MKSQKIVWLHGAANYAERHEMSAVERIAAETRATAMAGESHSEIIVTTVDVSAVVARRAHGTGAQPAEPTFRLPAEVVGGDK